MLLQSHFCCLCLSGFCCKPLFMQFIFTKCKKIKCSSSISNYLINVQITTSRTLPIHSISLILQIKFRETEKRRHHKQKCGARYYWEKTNLYFSFNAAINVRFLTQNEGILLPVQRNKWLWWDLLSTSIASIVRFH